MLPELTRELGWSSCSGSVLPVSHPLSGTSGQELMQGLLMMVREVQMASPIM